MTAVESVINPRSVALVGASTRPRAAAGRIRGNLRRYGYRGDVYLVNPRYQEIGGERCYPGVAALPRPVDHVVVLVPADQVVDVVREAGEAGAKSALVYAGGFSESGTPEGEARTRALREVVRHHGIRVCGPNTMGTYCPGSGAIIFTNDAPPDHLGATGSFSLLAQSGGMAIGIGERAAERGVGFRYVVDSGNEVDLDLVDFLEFFLADPGTEVIGLFVEAVRRPAEFRRLCGVARATGKPLIALRSGRSPRGRAAARSHTSALSGSYEVFSALCRSEGVMVVDSVDDAVEAAVLFTHLRGRPAAGPAFLTVSGALRNMMMDACEEARLATPPFSAETVGALAPRLPPGSLLQNPLDLSTGVLSSEAAFGELAGIVAADPAIGLLAVQSELPLSPEYPGRTATNHQLAALAAETGKPVLFFTRGSYNVTAHGREVQASIGAPFLQDAFRTARAVAGLYRYQLHAERAVRREAGPRPALDLRGLAADDPWGDLRARGFPLVPGVLGTTEAEWRGAFEAFGPPVVVKAGGGEVLHKTEIGAVAVGLTTADAVVSAARRIQSALGGPLGTAAGAPILIQPHVRGVEVLVGSGVDPELGPFVLVGWGGLAAEVVGDTAALVPPVTEDDVREALEGLRVRALLAGLRGAPPADVAALVGFVAAFTNGVPDLPPDIRSLEFNPVLVRPEGRGLVIVDIAVERGPGAAAAVG